MKRVFPLFGVLALLAGLTITGCRKDDTTAPTGDQPPAGVTNEQTAMANSASTDEFVTNAADVYAFADPGVAPTNYSDATGLSKTDTAINPLRWGRFISSISRTIDVNILPGDTMAFAHITRTVIGTLKIRTTIGGVDSVFTKPFADTTGKNVIFRRVAHDTKRYWLNWVPVASSLVIGGTSPMPANSGIVITKLQLLGGGDSVTITDPEAFWLRYKWLNMFRGGRGDVPQFTMGDSVSVTATVMSQSSDTDMVALRHGFGLQSLRYQRARMTLVSQSGPDGNGFYTKVYTKSIMPRFGIGSFYVGVDALTKATLYDTNAPYSASWWGVPYRMF